MMGGPPPPGMGGGMPGPPMGGGMGPGSMGPGGGSGMGGPLAPPAGDGQPELLQQLLMLTPAQIERLPPDQRQQVLALQSQMGGGGEDMEVSRGASGRSAQGEA